MTLAILGAVLGGVATGFGMANMIPPLQRYFAQTSNKVFPNELLPVQAYIEAYHRGIISKDDLYEYAQRQGLHIRHTDILIDLYKKLPEVGLLVTGYYRGFIDEEKFKKYMHKLGYDDEHIELVKKVYKAYPSPSDFIRFAVRDVFNPERAKKYELTKEFPEEIVPYAEKTGMDKEVLMWYWMAHWELPSPEMVMRMVNMLQHDVLYTKLSNGKYYGEKYQEFVSEGKSWKDLETNYKELSEFLAMADISPYWRDRMKVLTFPPITRVDLRRLYQLGIIDENELYARLLELGYSPLDAKRMMQFYKMYKIESERDLTKSEILTFYAERFIKYDEAKKYLMEIGYSDDEADFLLTITDEKVTLERMRYRIDALELQYQKGIIDEQKFREELAKMNLPADKIEYEVDKARDKKLKYEKLPSKTELIKMKIMGEITEKEYYDYMERNGYSKHWAEKLLKVYGG